MTPGVYKLGREDDLDPQTLTLNRHATGEEIVYELYQYQGGKCVILNLRMDQLGLIGQWVSDEFRRIADGNWYEARDEEEA
jgi:hypothetical protein